MFLILQFPFIHNAFFAGSLIAIVNGVLGYFLVIRGLTFAGHALSSIGFAGAAGAVLLGVPPAYGLLIFTIGASLVISTLPFEVHRARCGHRCDHDLCSKLGDLVSFTLSWLR